MALFVYARHTSDCPKKSDRFWKRCRCPKWIRGLLNGSTIRQTADTRSWEKAEDKRRQLEEEAEQRAAAIRTGEAPSRTSEPISVKDAVKRFLASKRNENLAESTLDKLTTIFQKQFSHWASSAGFQHLADITTADLEAFRDTWTDGPLAKKKTGTVGRVFLLLHAPRLDQVQSRGSVGSNPSGRPAHGLLSKIRVRSDCRFNLHLPAEGMAGMPQSSHSAPRLDPSNALEWPVAIRDAVTLERRRLNDKDELFLYRAKTGNPVYVPLPHDVAESLRNIPPGPSPNPRYFFWSGNGSPKSVVGNWQRSFRRLFNISNIRRDDGSPKRCHPHMFRDTFAVEMLLAGVPLEQVSILLGHKSVKITEKHYAPWVKARQDQLAANVRMAWEVFDSGDKRSKRKAPKSVRRSA